MEAFFCRCVLGFSCEYASFSTGIQNYTGFFSRCVGFSGRKRNASSVAVLSVYVCSRESILSLTLDPNEILRN